MIEMLMQQGTFSRQDIAVSLEESPSFRAGRMSINTDYIDTDLEIKYLNSLGINHLTVNKIKQSKKRKKLLEKMNKQLKSMGF